MEEALDSIQHKCENCGGNLKFSPKDHALKCEFCKSLKSIACEKNVEKHEYTDNVENTSQYKEFVGKAKFIKCQNCGASIAMGNLQISKTCPYCGSPSVMEIEEMKGITPDGIIPFELTEEDALLRLRESVRKKWLAPGVLKKHFPIDNIKGIYIPFFSFDSSTKSSYEGVLVKETRDSDGDTHRRYFDISGGLTKDYKNLNIEVSSHINQLDYEQIKPYNLQGLNKFDSAFIMGYSVEYYNHSLNVTKKLAEDLFRAQIKQDILSEYDYTYVDKFTLNTTFSDVKYSYYLLPIYNVTYKYKNKSHTMIVNGQTGVVSSNYPKSAVKVTMVTILSVLFVIGFVLLCLFAE